MVVTYKQKFNRKYGQPLNQSNSLRDIARLTGYKLSGLQTIYNKGTGAYVTVGPSRPNMTKEQWSFSRVYSAVMGGKAQKIDKSHLMKKGK